MLKGEARRYASEEGIMVVGPDTSPSKYNFVRESLHSANIPFKHML